MTEPPAPETAPAPPPSVVEELLSPPGATDPVSVSAEDTSEKLIWRGSSFTFNQAGTTTIFGIGRDNIGGEDESYGWDFTFRPSVYLLDRKKDTLQAFAEIGWATEFTNGSTVDRRETQFKDVQIGARYGHTIWESGGDTAGDYKTSGFMTLRLALPTSPVSYNSGKYLTLAVGPQVSQRVKLLGSKAQGLNDATVTLGLTYAHLFSRSDTPTNPDLRRPRQNATGETIFSDQLSRYSFDIDRLTTSLGLSVPLYKELSLATAARLISRWKHDFDAGAGSGCDVKILNDPCVQAGRMDDRTLYQVSTSFDVALSYPIYEVASVTLGYNNDTAQIGEDGQRRNFFYSPDAQFYLDLTANLDSIYSKVTGRTGAKTPRTAVGTSQPAL